MEQGGPSENVAKGCWKCFFLGCEELLDCFDRTKWTKRKVMIVIGSIVVMLAVIFGVAMIVVAAQNKPSSSSSSISQGAGTGDDSNNNNPINKAAIKYYDYQHNFFYFKSEEPESMVTPLQTLESCVSFCWENNFDSGYFRFGSGNSCGCYQSTDIECILPSGDNIDIDYYAEGSLFTTGIFGTCNDITYCDVHLDDHICLTGHQFDLSAGWPYAGGSVFTNTTEVSSDYECLELCGTYDGAVYEEPDSCRCVDLSSTSQQPCRLDWGNVYPSSGTYYSRFPVSSCNSNYCSHFDYRDCLRDHQFDLSDGWVYTEDVVWPDSTEVKTENECLQLCGENDGALFQEYSYSEKYCRCIDLSSSNSSNDDDSNNNNVCRLDWGIANPASGSYFSKVPVSSCNRTYCDIFPNQTDCQV